MDCKLRAGKAMLAALIWAGLVAGPAGAQQPDVGAWVRATITKYDADANGRLEPAEVQAAIASFAQMTPDQRIAELTPLMDVNGNGVLEPEERAAIDAATGMIGGKPKQAAGPAINPAVMQQLQMLLQSPAGQQLVQRFDTNGNGNLEPDELQAAAAAISGGGAPPGGPGGQQAGMAGALRMLDRDGNGEVSAVEMQVAMGASAAITGRAADPQKAAQLVQMFDLDRSGGISAQEMEQAQAVGEILTSASQGLGQPQ